MTRATIDKLFFQGHSPRLCVPLTGNGMPALLHELKQVSALPADLYEWRVDCFFGDPLTAISSLREALPGKPFLFTVRTKAEGGQAELSPEEYERLVLSLLDSGACELIDIELSCGEERVERLVTAAHDRGVLAVVSKHDFQKTPTEAELVSTLLCMSQLGADLPKYAVMPQTRRDVLTLLSATVSAAEQVGPVITMSMGELGKITRVSGAYFGSCVTFGAGESASAPGQIGAEDLCAILRDLSPKGIIGKGETANEK